MNGAYVDLHCHYVPGVDDGVDDVEQGVVLCQGLRTLGFETVVATPHMRTAMFDNRRGDLMEAFAAFAATAAHRPSMPTLGLGAEHFFDDVFWERFLGDEAVPYPGGRAALIELPPHQIPLGLPRHLFTMTVRGVHPVLAHPERYRPVMRGSEALMPLLDAGALPLLDLMSLVERYGTGPRRAAERLLEEGHYAAACSDAHRPEDLDRVARAIDRLRALVGEERLIALLDTGPRRILAGTHDGTP